MEFSLKMYFSTAGKYIIAILPPGIKASEILDCLIIQPCLQLERGRNFTIVTTEQKNYRILFWNIN